MAKTATINLGDHVHYAPDEMEVDDASLTPTYIVVFTNGNYAGLTQLGAPGLSAVQACPIDDLVAAHPDDLTEIQPSE